MDEFNEISVTIRLTKNNILDEKFLYSIINSLNDEMIPVSEIKINDEVVFNDKQGFTKRGGNDVQSN